MNKGDWWKNSLKVIGNTVKSSLNLGNTVLIKAFLGLFLTASCSMHTHSCSAAVIYWKLREHASRPVGFQQESYPTKVAKGFWSHCLGPFYCGWWRFTMLSIIFHSLSLCELCLKPNGCGKKLGNVTVVGGFMARFFSTRGFHTWYKQINKCKHIVMAVSTVPNNEAAPCEQMWTLSHTQTTNNTAWRQLCCHVYAEGQC